ncbi:MAG TPA: GDSL-type esterase/lipase family protein [Roseiarcus sp.]
MQDSSALLVWALALLVGAGGVSLTVNGDAGRLASDPTAERALDAASNLVAPDSAGSSQAVLTDPRLAAWRPPPPPPPLEAPRPLAPAGEPSSQASAAAPEAAPEPAQKLLRVAMLDAPAKPPHAADGLKGLGALSALEAAMPSIARPPRTVSAYGELDPDLSPAPRRLTILQLGDSHTAADFFTGRVRERLQQVFGAGGLAYVVPGRPNIGVRSALFESDASEGWTYEALQRSDQRRRFYLSGFNAVAHHAGAMLNMRARGSLPYDRVEVAFLKQPGGGRAEVLVDGKPGGEINLDGPPDQRATLDVLPDETGAHGFRDVEVKALTDAPVTVTGVEVARDGDGVSYVSLGFPGATVQVLQKLETGNLADDLKRMAPDVIVLAFGTNEGFNDALDIPTYTEQYEQIVRRLQALRPGLRIIMIGPPDGARPAGVCHNSAVGHDCATAPQPVAAEGGGPCRFPTPPKLPQVREAQRRLAERLGVDFWDWSSVMPGPCGAQVWAAANPPLMAHDYVHMTLEGYKRSADRFADYLIPLIGGRQTGAHVVSND